MDCNSYIERMIEIIEGNIKQKMALGTLFCLFAHALFKGK